MLLSVFGTFSAYAKTESGSCGPEAVYELKNGVLTISGTGEITSSPWRGSKEEDDTLKKLIIENGITEISVGGAFSKQVELKEAKLPASLKEVPGSLFYECSKLEKVILPSGITQINGKTFYKCKRLKEIIIPDSVTKIKENAFFECESLEKADIPNKVTFIGNRAFYGCSSLKRIVLPDSLTSVYAYAFAGCSSAEGRLTIPNNLDMYGYVFKDCTSISELCFKGEAGSITRTGVFNNCTGVKKIYIEKYMSVLPHYSFDSCTNISCVVISEGIKSINNLNSIKTLKTVTLPKSAEKIEDSAFYGCTKLKNVKAQSKLDYIGEKAFVNCPDVTIKLPYGVGKIGECALGYTQKENSTDYQKISNFKIYGKECKAITNYCSKNGFKFVDMYDVKNATATMKSQVYNGKAKKPAVTLKLAGVTLQKGTDFTVKYSNNTKVGTAKVTIKGKGKYKGTLTKTFKINPKFTELTKLTPKSKSFKAYWKNNKSQTSGYQLQYSVYKSFKNAKKVTVKGYKTGAKTIKNLKSKKKYFVRVRTYKVVNNKKYYSKWSNSKTVKTK